MRIGINGTPDQLERFIEAINYAIETEDVSETSCVDGIKNNFLGVEDKLSIHFQSSFENPEYGLVFIQIDESFDPHEDETEKVF